MKKDLQDVPFIELMKWENYDYIPQLLKKYQGSENDAMVGLLEGALKIKEKTGDLAEQRERVRRGEALSNEDLLEVLAVADRAEEDAFEVQYALMEMLQAAAVAHCGHELRYRCAIRLGDAAAHLEKLERARDAYADALETLEIIGRFFNRFWSIDEDHLLQMQEALRQRWEGLRQGTETSYNLLDPVSEDPSGEWIDLIRWNSDEKTGFSLLGHCDAAMRLALRMENWKDRAARPLPDVVDRMVERCRKLREGDDPRQPARFLNTLGYALVEVGEWSLAGKVYREASHPEMLGPLDFHAIIQTAYCDLQEGRADSCRDLLDKVDQKMFSDMARLVITVAGERARYLAVRHLCNGRLGLESPAEIEEEVGELLQRVTLIVSPKAEDRTSYLRNLFFSLLARDVEACFAETGIGPVHLSG